MQIPGAYRPPEPGTRRSPGKAVASLWRRGLRQAALRALPFESATAQLVDSLLDVPDDVITMGRWSYFDGMPTVHRYPGAPDERIEIGSFCSLAKDIAFVLSGNHDPRRVTTSPVRQLFGVESYETSGEMSGRGSITIGHDVWVGRGALLLSGTTVGHGAVIGARAVVSGTVPPYAVVLGNPAQQVRRRFDDATVERLLASAWWDLPEDVLRSAVDLLSSRDVEAFLSHVEGLRARG